MRLIKNIAKAIIHNQGYDVIKLAPVKEREIYNAYYLGNCFKCIKGDPLTDTILKGKIWDNQIPDILKTVTQRDGLIVEIGANIGASILPHSKNYPDKRFKLFEPVPAFFKLLKENHQQYNEKKNVEIFNLGFGLNNDEDILINVGLGTAGKSKLVQYQMADQTIKIPSKKIDSFLAGEKVAFIKIDVDGHELNILRGGENLLREQTPVLFLEYAPKVIADIGQTPEEIPYFLKDLGYNEITIWDNYSQFIKKTNDWDELIRIAKATPHYLDLLISKV